MNKREYRRALESARFEFDKLLQERLELEKRILNLRQTIAGLIALCEPDGKHADFPHDRIPFPRSIKLTSAIRQILAESETPISPPELRNGLIRGGLDMSNYANQLSVVHNTLIRLQRQGQAVQVSGAWVLTEKGRLASKMDFIGSPLSRQAKRR